MRPTGEGHPPCAPPMGHCEEAGPARHTRPQAGEAGRSHWVLAWSLCSAAGLSGQRQHPGRLSHCYGHTRKVALATEN